MASADTQLTVDDEPQSKKKKFMIVLGIGLLVLAAGGGFLLWKFVFHSSGGAGAEQASASSQVEPLKLTPELPGGEGRTRRRAVRLADGGRLGAPSARGGGAASG